MINRLNLIGTSISKDSPAVDKNITIDLHYNRFTEEII